MKGSNEPAAATNFCHFSAKTAMITAAKFSIVKPGDWLVVALSCDNDIIGGEL